MKRLEITASPDAAMIAIWDALRALGRTLGEPIPGDGEIVQVNMHEYAEMRRIENMARASKLSEGKDGKISVAGFIQALDRLDMIRSGTVRGKEECFEWPKHKGRQDGHHT